MIIKERYRGKLKEHNLTQTTLAEMLGVSSGTLSNIVNGRQKLTGEMRHKIAEALDCDDDWLVGNDRAINRNASGVPDPTAFKALKKDESMQPAEYAQEQAEKAAASNWSIATPEKGSIWELTYGTNLRKAVVVSGDVMLSKKKINVLILKNNDFGGITVPVKDGFVDCTKVVLVDTDKLSSVVGHLTPVELMSVDMGLSEAFNIQANHNDPINGGEEIARLQKTIEEQRDELANQRRKNEEQLEKMRGMKARIDELAEKQVPEMGHEMLRVACDEGAEIVRLRAEADTYKHMYFDLLDRVTK